MAIVWSSPQVILAHFLHSKLFICEHSMKIYLTPKFFIFFQICREFLVEAANGHAGQIDPRASYTIW